MSRRSANQVIEVSVDLVVGGKTRFGLRIQSIVATAEVKRIAEEKINEIDRKLAELNAMRATLSHLAESRHGDDRPDCPILDDLAGLAQRL